MRRGDARAGAEKSLPPRDPRSRAGGLTTHCLLRSEECERDRTNSPGLSLHGPEAKLRLPGLVIASLGAQRKEKPGGKVSARVLFDGTHGLSVNTKTRLRDQERAPIAADLKRSMASSPSHSRQM